MSSESVQGTSSNGTRCLKRVYEGPLEDITSVGTLLLLVEHLPVWLPL